LSITFLLYTVSAPTNLTIGGARRFRVIGDSSEEGMVQSYCSGWPLIGEPMKKSEKEPCSDQAAYTLT